MALLWDYPRGRFPQHPAKILGERHRGGCVGRGGGGSGMAMAVATAAARGEAREGNAPRYLIAGTP